jgi:serine/threonine protein kinase
MRRWLPDATLEHLRRVADRPDLGDDRYEVLDEIGRGGMGTVYRVRDRELGRDVALKVLSAPDAEGALAARMRNEARVLASLEHPGIVPIHDVGTLADGRTWYLMKLVEGSPLDAHARAETSLGGRLRLFERICEAVAFAHARGVVHRDLKPSNVMVGAFGEVLVLDWGVAGRLEEESEGEVLGTPGFMAPEQARGGAADERSDVYSLGAILSFLLGGSGPPPLEAVCRKARSEAPAERYATVDALRRDVAAYLERLPVSAYRESAFERVRRLAVKYKTPILLVLAYLTMRVALFFFGGR